MSEFVKLKKEWAPREEQHPRMFWVQSSVLRTIIVYYMWSYPGSEQRDFFFFNKYRSNFSSAQNLLSSELSFLWSHLPSPVPYSVLPLILLPPLGSASCFLNRAKMLLSPGLYAWGFFLECRRRYTSFFSDGEAMRKILRQGVVLVMCIIIDVNIGLAKKFIWVCHPMLQETQTNFLANPTQSCHSPL